MLRVTNKLMKYFDAQDALSLAQHDRAATKRRLRALEEEVKRAAKEYANAKVYWKAKRFDLCASTLGKELKGLNFKYQKMELLLNQMEIILIGGGFKDLEFKKGKKGEHCTVCGHANDDELAHLTAHVKKCYCKIRSRGGWPKAPPRPKVTVKKLPPIESEDSEQTAAQHPVYQFIRRIEDQAEERVQKGRVQADIALVDEHHMPEINDELIGRRMEYIFQVPVTVTKSGRKLNQLWCYRGTIQSVFKEKTKGKRKELVHQVLVEWDEEEEGEDKVSAVLLEPKDWCTNKKDGWAVLEDTAGCTSTEQTVLQRMDQHVLETEMLVPKEE